MAKSFISTRLVAWFIIFAAPVIAKAQALADRVPADTIFYVGWQGVESPGPGYDGSHLQAVLNESNMPRVFDEFLPQVLDRIAKEDKQAAEIVGIFRAIAGPMWRNPSAIAFGGVDMKNANGPTPKLVLVSKAGKDSARLQKQVQGLLDKAGPLPFQVQVAQVDDLVGVFVGYDKPQEAIIAAGKDGKSLANDPSFSKALAEVGKDPVIAGYIDIEGFLAHCRNGRWHGRQGDSGELEQSPRSVGAEGPEARHLDCGL